MKKGFGLCVCVCVCWEVGIFFRFLFSLFFVSCFFFRARLNGGREGGDGFHGTVKVCFRKDMGDVFCHVSSIYN